jgi:2-iminobutanoate/2-iminopropanoate deaminase
MKGSSSRIGRKDNVAKRRASPYWLSVPIAALLVLMTQPSAGQGGSGAAEHAPRQYLNPDGLTKPNGYTQVVVVSEPTKLIYISGQTARSPGGQIVGKGDLRAQVTQAMENLRTALSAAGATMEDIVKLNYYVVNLQPEQVAIIREVREKYLRGEHPPAATLVGVTALAAADLMVEIEAVAAKR